MMGHAGLNGSVKGKGWLNGHLKEVSLEVSNECILIRSLFRPEAYFRT